MDIRGLFIFLFLGIRLDTGSEKGKINLMKSEIKCHVCGEPFNVIPSAKGVFVRCDNPACAVVHENVYGFGKNEKEAAEIAAQKYKVSR